MPTTGILEQDVLAAIGQWASGQNQNANDPDVLRKPVRDPAYPRVADSWDPAPPVTKPYSQYSAEFQEKLLEDPIGFQKWLSSRAAAFNVDLIDKDGNFDVKGGENFWSYIGGLVAMNPTLRSKMMPETYADQRYLQMGGDAAYEAYLQTKAVAKDNPIYTSTSSSTSYNLMPDQAAEAAVDQLASSLLGRMASEKEMNRYRKQINAFLKANPSKSSSTTVSNSDTNTSDTTSTSKSGASPSDALAILEQKIKRGSEGMAFNAGQLIESAMSTMDRGL